MVITDQLLVFLLWINVLGVAHLHCVYKTESDLYKTESWPRTKCTYFQYKFAM